MNEGRLNLVALFLRLMDDFLENMGTLRLISLR